MKISQEKRKDVKDLVRFIENITDEGANFSFLLGSGCSHTSGVRTAGELISAWKRDVYSQLKAESLPNEEIPEGFFDQFDWYEKENEYSSFFEKLYDLKKHRKSFIEKEISGKIPAIGYAYLAKLAEAGLADTIFTTNFDDLINEAFYLYGDSETRPIVCAHDSSIDSITPLSRRPKIIKLHGDYLFDNIKAVSGETNTLEENMRKKVEEYARIKGLIVIGYGGHDNSIMDALLDLVKEDDKYTQGIYWCVRHRDPVSEKVKELIQKERCYYVPIDGFDEMMHELVTSFDQCKDINLNEIPRKVLGKLLSNETIFSTTSKSLLNKLEEYKERYRRLSERDPKSDGSKGYMDDFENTYGENEDDGVGITLDESNTLNKLREYLQLGEYDSAIQKINALLKEKLDNNFSRKLRSFKAAAYHEQERYAEAQKIVRELINEEPYRIENYLNLISSTPGRKEKLTIINKVLQINPYESEFYYIKGQLLHKSASEDLRETLADVRDEINETLLEGEKYSNEVSNPCWRYYFDFNYDLIKGNADALQSCKSILSKYQNLYPSHYEIIRRQVYLFQHEEKKVKDVFEYIDSTRLKGNTDENLDYALLKLRYAWNLKDNGTIKELFMKYDIRYSSESRYAILKAKIWYDFYRDLGSAIDTLKRYIEDNETAKNTNVKKLLVNYYIAQGNVDEAVDLIEKSGNKRDFEKYFNSEILALKEDWEGIIEEANRKIHIEGETVPLLAQKSHALLMAGNFKEVKELLHPKIKDNIINNPVLLINCELADSKLRERVNKIPKKRERIERIAHSTECDRRERAAAYILLDDFDHAIEQVRLDLREGFSSEQSYRNNYVFTKFKNDVVSQIIAEVKHERIE